MRWGEREREREREVDKETELHYKAKRLRRGGCVLGVMITEHKREKSIKVEEGEGR